MLGSLLRALMPPEIPAPSPRPIVLTNEPEGPGRGDGFAFDGPCPILDFAPEGGFPVLVVHGGRAL